MHSYFPDAANIHNRMEAHGLSWSILSPVQPADDCRLRNLSEIQPYFDIIVLGLGTVPYHTAKIETTLDHQVMYPGQV